MTVRRSLAVGAVLVMAITYFLLRSEPAQKTPATPEESLCYLIFVDPTSSLEPSEVKSVARQAGDIVRSAAEGTHLKVIPIGREVDLLPALFESTVPVPILLKDRAEMAGWLEEKARFVEKTVEASAPLINDDPESSRSCISGALRRAEEIIKQAPTGMRFEIVLISDMVEECKTALGGEPRELDKRDVGAEIASIRALPSTRLLDLRRATVTALIPTSLAAARPKPRRPGQRLLERPPVAQLRQYWRALLDRCNDAPERFAFGPDVPERFRSHLNDAAARDGVVAADVATNRAQLP